MAFSTKKSLLACASIIVMSAMVANPAQAASVVVNGANVTAPIALGAGESLTYTTANKVTVDNSVGAVVTINGNGASINTTNGNATEAITTTGTLGGPVIDIVAGGTNATITNAAWKDILEAAGSNQSIIRVDAAGATINNNDGAVISSDSTGPTISLLGGATGFTINNNLGNIRNTGSGTAITLANGAAGTITNTQGTIEGAIDNSANASSITLNLGSSFSTVTGDILFGSGNDIINNASGSHIGIVTGGTGSKGTLNATAGTSSATAVGSGTSVAAVNVSNGATLIVAGDVAATAIGIAGTGILNSGGDITGTTTFTGAGTLRMTGVNKTLTGDVVTTGGGTSGYGTVTVSGTGTTLSGQLGSSTADRVMDIVIANVGTTTASNIIDAANLSFEQDGTLEMTRAAGGSNITAVTTVTDDKGTLTVSNTSGMNTFGAIGDSTHALKDLNITGNGGMTTVSGDLYAKNMAISSGADLEMSSNVSASSLTINGSGSVNFYDNATITTTTFTGSNDGSLALRTGGTTFASDVVTTGCGTIGCGYITALAAGQTFSGKLGSSATDRLTGLYVQNTGTTTASNTVDVRVLTFWDDGILALTDATGGSDITSANTSASNTGTLTISNTSGTNTFGTIGNSTHELKALNLTGSGGATLINDDMFVTNTNIGNGSILRVGTTGKTFTGAMANNGTFALGDNTVTVDGNITGTNGTITTTIGGASSGNIINTSNTTNATFLTGLSVTPTVSDGVTINNHDKIVLVHGNTGVAAVDPSAISTVASSGLLRWSLSAGTAGTDFYGNAFSAQDLVLTASRFVISEISGVNTGVMPVIGNLDSYTGSNTAVLALQSELQNLTTGEQLNKAGAQLAPQTNDSDRAATIETVRTALNTLSVREETLRGAQIEQKGISSGEALSGSGVWTQGFGSLVSEGIRESVNGYDSATGGAAFGADARVLKNLRAGALLAYANTNVDETGDRKGSGLGINSYIGTIYGTYTGTPWYVDGAVTMGYHDYRSTRLVDALGTTQTAKGSYVGKQYGASAEVGYPMQIVRVILTPFATLAYNFLDQSGYTESGAPGADLTVKGKNTDSIRSGLGAKVSGTVGVKGSWKFVPSARGAWMHEFNTNAPSITSSYAGGSSFTTQGIQLAQEAGIVGLGLEAKSESGLSFSAKYDSEIREQYLGHNFMLQLRQEF